MPSSSPIRRMNKLAVYLDDLKDLDDYVPPKRGVASELRSRKMQLAKLSNLETLENFDLRVFNVEDLCQLNNLRKLGAIVSSKDDLRNIVEYLIDKASEHLLHVAISIKYCDLCSEDGQTLLEKLLRCSVLRELSIDGRTVRDELDSTTQGGVFIREGPSGLETSPGKVDWKIPTTESNTDDDKYVPDDEMDLRDEPDATTQEGVFIRGGPSGLETRPGKADWKIPTTESNTDDDKYVPDDEMDCIWQFG
ncbi:hypothetical protein LguiB_026730 [Lonicera macranthoides]